MTTIQFNDPIIANIIKQEGLENITNDVLEYIKNKFSKKTKSPLSAYLDQQIRSAKATNTQKADKLNNAIEELNSLVSDKNKSLSSNEVKENHFTSKANLT